MFDPDSTRVRGSIPIELPDGTKADARISIENGEVHLSFEETLIADTLLTLAVNGHLQSLVLGYDMVVPKS